MRGLTPSMRGLTPSTPRPLTPSTKRAAETCRLTASFGEFVEPRDGSQRVSFRPFTADFLDHACRVFLVGMLLRPACGSFRVLPDISRGHPLHGCAFHTPVRQRFRPARCFLQAAGIEGLPCDDINQALGIAVAFARQAQDEVGRERRIAGGESGNDALGELVALALHGFR